MNRLCYILGSPGSGKSTLLAAALEGVPTTKLFKLAASYCDRAPMAGGAGSFDIDTSYRVTGHQIGRAMPGEHGAFPGTDSLGMSEQPAVCSWLSTLTDQNVVAEGDRLANASFFTWIRQNAWDLDVVYLDTPANVLAERRAKRAAEVGKGQNEAWVSGRETKCAKLASQFVGLQWWLDGSKPLPELVARLREHPVIRAIRNEV